MRKLSKLAIDLYKGNVANYSNEQATDVLRKELIELNGGSEKITPKSFRNNPELFAIIEEALDVLIVEGLEGQFDDFVEQVQLDWGDTKVFTIEEHRLFNVGVTADGNGDIRRDRLDKGEITVKTQTMSVGIYEELHRLMAGKVDWAKMVENVARSYNNKIKTKIYNALYEAGDSLNSTYRKSGTLTSDALVDLIAHVEAGTGMEAIVLGTKKALSKVQPDQVSDRMKDERNRLGYFGNFNGTDMVEIKQAHKPGGSEFAIDDNFLMVIPRTPDRLVKLVLEGESILEETTEGRNDMQRDYRFIKRAGIAVISSSKYGFYNFS